METRPLLSLGHYAAKLLKLDDSPHVAAAMCAIIFIKNYIKNMVVKINCFEFTI
jgi:hypothetical protein